MCRGRFFLAANFCAKIRAQLSETQGTKIIFLKMWQSEIMTKRDLRYLPWTLWSLNIQYTTPPEPRFILASRMKRSRFWLNSISFCFVLFCITRFCSQPPDSGFFFFFSSSFTGGPFCCFALGALAAELAFRFVLNMAALQVNFSTSRERTLLRLELVQARSFKLDFAGVGDKLWRKWRRGLELSNIFY